MNSLSTIKTLLKKYWILLLLITVKFIIQYALINPVYDLHRDEFLHLDQAFHPAAGYISVPPFTSWIASIIYLFGGGLFWIRFFPTLFGALTILFIWLTVEETEGGITAKILASVAYIFSVYVRMNMLFQPNSFDVLAWIIMFYLLIKYFNSLEEKWLLLFAIITALAFYNKYNVVFLIAGLLGGILFTNHRVIFTKRIFYVTLILCIVLMLPNIIWQFNYNLPVIHHMKALKETQLVNVSMVGFLFDQVRFGLIGILSLAALWALFFSSTFKIYRFIGWAFLITLTLYTLSHAKNYYSMGLYPVLFAIGSVYLEVVLKKWKTPVMGFLAVSTVVVFFFIVRYLMPYQDPSEIIKNRVVYERIGLLKWEDGINHPLPQDFSDMLGWREMADKAFLAYKMIPKEELKYTLVFCDNYGQTGALNYYNRKKMPQAYSFNNDYVYWLPNADTIKNAILVGDEPDKEAKALFKRCVFVGSIENPYSREQGTSIYLLTGANPRLSEIMHHDARYRIKNFYIF